MLAGVPAFPACRSADAIVIGGGCIGASITYHLAARGIRRVSLIEKDGLATGATGRSTGIIRVHYSHETVARMAIRSLETFRHFDDVIGGDVGFTPCGWLLGVGRADVGALRSIVAMLRGLGASTRELTGSELEELEPGIDAAGIAAVAYEPESGYADPYLTTIAFVRRARELGATIMLGTTVTGLRIRNDHVEGVETTQGYVAAPIVVNAAGDWAPALARLAGTDLRVRITRHPICVLRRPPGVQVPRAVYTDFINGVYFKPEPGPPLVLGLIGPPQTAASELDPGFYQPRLDHETIAEFAQRATGRFPALAQAGHQGGYMATYDETPDQHFLLGAMPPIEGMYVAAGFSGHGFKHCPVIGAMLAELITTGACKEFDWHMFRPTRFVEGEYILGKYVYSAAA